MVHRRQLIAAGLAASLTRGLIESGFLHRLFRGVYAVGHLALPRFGPEQAALLAAGDGAVISHASALYLWGIRDRAPPVVDVTVSGSYSPRPGIRFHRTLVNRRDIRVRHGLPVVSPAVSLIGFARTAGLEELGDAVAEARVKSLIREGELEAAVKRFGRRAARMRTFLKDEGGPAITRSRAERDFRRYLHDAQLPQPRTNARVAGYEADFLWEKERVILEVDGWRYHAHRRAFERDRKKGMVLNDAGFHVTRVTSRQFTDELLFVIAHVARTLDRRTRGAG